jgi:hypothetical protein
MRAPWPRRPGRPALVANLDLGDTFELAFVPRLKLCEHAIEGALAGRCASVDLRPEMAKIRTFIKRQAGTAGAEQELILRGAGRPRRPGRLRTPAAGRVCTPFTQ